MINQASLQNAFQTFKEEKPFDHCVIDQFLDQNLATALEKDFLDYDSPKWFVYKNSIEDKKALNDWNIFPSTTYHFFNYLNSAEFVSTLSSYLGIALHADSGLHGGGWHLHGPGGEPESALGLFHSSQVKTSA